MESKYNSFTEWRKVDPKAYRKALELDIIEDICKIFGWKNPNMKPTGYWNVYENCLKYALSCRTIKELKKQSQCYRNIRLNNWDDCIKHIKLKSVPNGYWNNIETCRIEALKYDFQKDLIKNASACYENIRKNNWFNECCGHMKKFKPKGFWNIKENVLYESLKYNTVKDWKENCYSSYQYAIKNGWLKECTAHMVRYKNK